MRDVVEPRFIPVTELAGILKGVPAPDPESWRSDLDDAVDVFGPDVPTDPWTHWR